MYIVGSQESPTGGHLPGALRSRAGGAIESNGQRPLGEKGARHCPMMIVIIVIVKQRPLGKKGARLSARPLADDGLRCAAQWHQ